MHNKATMDGECGQTWTLTSPMWSSVNFTVYTSFKVTKNRFDGTLGKVYLDFNRETLTLSSYQTNSTDITVKKENKNMRSVKPPKTASHVVNTKKTKVDPSEQLKTISSLPDVGTKSVSVGNKQRGYGGSRDSRTSGGSPSTTVVANGDLKKSNSNIVDSDVGNSQAKFKKSEQSKGTALNSKATRFNGYSTKKPVLTGQKISVKQLDVDNVYLQ